MQYQTRTFGFFLPLLPRQMSKASLGSSSADLACGVSIEGTMSSTVFTGGLPKRLDNSLCKCFGNSPNMLWQHDQHWLRQQAHYLGAQVVNRHRDELGLSGTKTLEIDESSHMHQTPNAMMESIFERWMTILALTAIQTSVEWKTSCHKFWEECVEDSFVENSMLDASQRPR